MRWLVAVVLLLVAGCGVQPSGVADGGEAPTGVAPGVVLYFVNTRGELEPQLRDTGRLGTITDALTLLLLGPGDPGLHNEIESNPEPPVVVTTAPGVVRLVVPLASYEVTPLGIDQIVCTALGVHVQSGGARSTKVQVSFTLGPREESARLRTCPLIS